MPQAKGEFDEDDIERRGMRMDGRKSDKSAKFNKYAKKIKGKAWVHKKKNNTETAASPSRTTQSLRDANEDRL